MYLLPTQENHLTYISIQNIILSFEALVIYFLYVSHIYWPRYPPMMHFISYSSFFSFLQDSNVQHPRNNRIVQLVVGSRNGGVCSICELWSPHFRIYKKIWRDPSVFRRGPIQLFTGDSRLIYGQPFQRCPQVSWGY